MAGFSLFECLMVSVIIAVLAVVTLPSLSSFWPRSTQYVQSHQLLNAIQLARHEAMMRQLPITLCPSQNKTSCFGQWNNGYIVTTNTTLIQPFDFPSKQGELHFRSFQRNFNFLRFSARGEPMTGNASFWYCSHQTMAWAIVVNRAGRARLVYPDASGHIVDETASQLVC